MKQCFILFLLLVSFGRAQAQADLKPVEVFPLDYAVPGNVAFGLTAMNIGTGVAPYFKVFWQVDNGPVSEALTSLTFPFSPNMIYPMRVTGNFVANFPVAGRIPIKIWIRNVNGSQDANPSNDTIVKIVKVMSYLPEKNVLFEVFKHQACCPCLPAAEYEAEFIDTMQHYAIANIYTGPTDVILNADGASVNAVYNLAHPAPLYDRFKFAYSTTVDRSWYTMDTSYILDDIGEREKYYEPIEVGIKSADFNEGTGLLTVRLKAKCYDTLTGDYRFNLYLTEDSIKAWQGCAEPDEYDYYHMHVTRAMMGGPWGEAGSLPATVYPGDEPEHEFSFTVPSTWKTSHMKLIPFVQAYDNDPLKRRILNTSKLKFDEALTLAVARGPQGSAGDYKVYPNPADKLLYIRHTGVASGAAGLDLLNLQGSRLLHKDLKEQETILDISALPAGNYFLRITNASGSSLQKLVKE